jgi:hypothetical protein
MHKTKHKNNKSFVFASFLQMEQKKQTNKQINKQINQPTNQPYRTHSNRD